MLVHANAVEPHLLSIFELVEILVIGDVAELRLVHAAGQIDPDRTMLLPEVVRHVRPRHEVEPSKFHGRPPVSSVYGGAGEPVTPCKTVSSIFTATPNPSPRPACGRPWPRPMSATSRNTRIPPSSACASGAAS